MISEQSRKAAEHFLQHETQFHLGAMLTEQPHPKTRGLSDHLARNTADGISMLLSVDDDIPPVARKVVESEAFHRLRNDILTAFRFDGRIFFSGCGATGRLAILLDAAHRKFCGEKSKEFPEAKEYFEHLADRSVSIMTGGDFALIRSVESFEDYIVFGERQVHDIGMKTGDCLVAISEGGETSSVIGTIHAALNVGAKVHFLFNNPPELLKDKIERSRIVLEDKRVNVLSLATGPMAIAGSTRMQATTIEMLVAGLAFESALFEHLRETLPESVMKKIESLFMLPQDGLERFDRLLSQLRKNGNVAVLSEIVDFEHSIYSGSGRVTYFSDEYSIDIFTDTTERSPTFKTPPFRSTAEPNSPPSWAFVKDPVRTTPEAWQLLLRRAPRCIAWKSEDYQAMGASGEIVANPPKIGVDILNNYRIGCETDESRTEVRPNAAIAFLIGNEAEHLAEKDDWFRAFSRSAVDFEHVAAILIGPYCTKNYAGNRIGKLFFIEVDIPETPLDLFAHLAAKLVLNNVSSATMGKLGRLSGNWMAHVDATNKKLIDRSIRLVSELTETDYPTACFSLFESMEEMSSWTESRRKTVSPVVHTIERIKQKSEATKSKTTESET